MSTSLIRFVTLAACLLLQACSAGPVVEAKEERWKAKLSEFQPIGKSRDDLLTWQRNNAVPLNSFPREEGTVLETVEGNSWVCSRWHIYLATESNEQGTITAYSVSSAASCL